MDIDLCMTLLIATFVSQLVIMSIVTPHRVSLYRRRLQEKYPPEQYPRLYPISAETMRQAQSISNVVDWVVFGAGAVALAVALIRSANTIQIASLMSFTCFVQILSKLPRLRVDKKIMRAYKSMEPPAVRTATFRIWTLWDFVSPAIVACGIVTTALSITAALIVVFSLQGQSKLIFRLALIVPIICMDIFLLVRMIRVLFQPLLPRLDPYATGDDVYRARKRRLRTLFVGSAMFAVVTTIELLVSTKFIELRVEYLEIGLSVIIQAISLLISTTIVRQLHTRDFSAYREATPGTTEISA